MRRNRTLIHFVITIAVMCLMTACGSISHTATTLPADSATVDGSAPTDDLPATAPPESGTTAPAVPEIIPPAQPSEPEFPSVPAEPGVLPTEPQQSDHIHGYNEQITAPSCTQPGIIHYICDCGDSYAGDELPATGHKWSEWKTIVPATGTAGGVSQRICSTCGKTEEQAVPKVEPHVHSYAEKVIQSGSCTKDRIVEHTCTCGKSYREEILAPGHAYGDWVVVKEATPDERGVEEITCATCGKVLSRTFAFCADNDDAEAIASLLIEYINDYRAEEGVAPATTMEQCTVYAKLRSQQMAAKGIAEHNTDDAQAAATQLQYGTYVDPAEYGRPDEQPYYHVNASEAVGMDGGTTVESVAAKFAEGFHSSAPHWRFVGTDPYIAVGMTMNSDGLWFCCIITSEENLDA